MRRRDLLKTLGVAALPAGVGGRLYAAPAAGCRLLVVFLRGAYDCANVLVPVDSSFYHAARPTIALAVPDPANPKAALALEAGWGLHPALRETILPLYRKGQAAFIPFAGSQDLSRSHFETQNVVERGADGRGSGAAGTGFLARLAAAVAGARPIAFTDQLPLILQGAGPEPNMRVDLAGRPAVDARQAGLIQSMYAGSRFEAAVREGFSVRDEVYAEVSAEAAAADGGAAPPKGFERAARRIAGLMQSDFNIGFVDVGGWDTHVNQGGAEGYLAGRLGELGRGLWAYADALGPEAWRSSVVVVVSEFGRTFRENGDRGTDHGHGTVYWVLGGGLRGGVLGRQVEVAEANLNQNRDYPVLNEYRAVLSGLFARMYDLKGGALETIFPGGGRLDLQLV